MTQAAHATKEDLVGTDSEPGFLSASNAALLAAAGDDEIERLLRRASDVVDDLAARAWFDVDENGNATDPNVAAGLRMATCAVVEFWLEVGEENDVDGLAGTPISVTGYTGPRAPEFTRRIMRPLKRAGLLAQPASMPAADWGLL